MKKESLIRDFNETNQNDFSDIYMILAKNIEDSLIETGGVPGKDYSLLDLYKLAQPFALHEFKKNILSFSLT